MPRSKAAMTEQERKLADDLTELVDKAVADFIAANNMPIALAAVVMVDISAAFAHSLGVSQNSVIKRLKLAWPPPN